VIVTRAPLRIPLGGGGTDFASYYSRYGGFLLSMAINKYVYVMLNRSPVDRLIRLKYSDFEVATTPDEIRHTAFRETLKFVGIDSSVEIATISDAAPGTGLGSSGSFTVALLCALHAFRQEAIDPHVLAEEAYEVEAIRAGLPVGKQDQYLAAFGGLICLNIGKAGKVTVDALNIDPDIIEKLTSDLLLFYTGIQRKSFSIPLQQDRDTKSGVKEVVGSLHTTKQIGLEIKEALEKGNLKHFGELLHYHWENKKLRSQEVSTPVIDRWYQIARDNGAMGGKVVGSGGGGFLMLYCPGNSKNKVRAAMAEEGLLEMEYGISLDGAKVLANV
jgi:D-glycero-alpha-D-manno-heptose-7-phosphate kinase